MPARVSTLPLLLLLLACEKTQEIFVTPPPGAGGESESESEAEAAPPAESEAEAEAESPDSGPATEGEAETDPLPGETRVGLSCDSDDGCPEGAELCLEGADGFPGGYCSRAGCNPAARDACDGGDTASACITFDREPICARRCGFDVDCREGYSCYPWGGGLALCLPLCLTDEDCRTGRACDNDDALGREPSLACYTPDAALGDACAGNHDCPLDAACLEEGAAGFPGGMCSLRHCASDGDCGADGDCVGAPDGECHPRCLGDVECRDGYLCRGGSCRPDCSSQPLSCLAAGFVCAASGLCTRPFTAGSLGAECDDETDDCPGGFCLFPSDGYPNGFCTTSIPEDCPSATGDGAMISLAGSSAFCAPTCGDDGDCDRPGFGCLAADGGDVCLPD